MSSHGTRNSPDDVRGKSASHKGNLHAGRETQGAGKLEDPSYNVARLELICLTPRKCARTVCGRPGNSEATGRIDCARPLVKARCEREPANGTWNHCKTCRLKRSYDLPLARLVKFGPARPDASVNAV